MYTALHTLQFLPKGLLRQWISEGTIDISEVHEILGHNVHLIDECGGEATFEEVKKLIRLRSKYTKHIWTYKKRLL